MAKKQKKRTHLCGTKAGGPKLSYGVGCGRGGARCQFFKHRGGLQVILIFKWYIIYSN